MDVVAPSRTVDEILGWYNSQNPGVLTNLYRLLNTGRLAGTGKLVILPVDQGFEHGPGRAYGPNPPSYDPHYHFRLAIESGCNAFAAPLGMIETGAADFAGQIPLILKVNNHDVLQDEIDPLGGLTSSVRDALRLGCVGIGYTIYPGTADRRLQYEQLRGLTEEARAAGLVVVVWAYPRGNGLKKEDETAIDVTAYAAQISAQLGAHIIKVKPPSAVIAQDAARKVYEKYSIPVSTMAERIAHVVESAFSGRRIVIFSGGEAKADEDVFAELRGIRDGGGFGSIMGRNAFQRPWDESLAFLDKVMSIYEGKL
jgi:class I fructose-bisphosphate aldolase